MKQFFKYILFVLVLSLISLKLLDILYSKVYAQGARTKFQYFRTYANKKVDYILLGSSRVENIINPEILDSITGKTTINLGVQSARLKDIFMFLKAIEDYKVAHEKIFIQLDYNYNLPDAYSFFLNNQLLPFKDESRAVEDYLSECDNNFMLDNFPFLRFTLYDQKLGVRELFANSIDKKSMVSKYNGFMPNPGTNFKSTYNLPSEIIAENKLFQEILEYIKTKNLNVGFFSSPMRPDTQNLKYFSLLKEKVPDLKDYSGAVKDPILFRDNLHLNDKGAAVFSLIFANDNNL
ncbi:hypothetical protein [Lacinutrix sp. Hel_I_90]|uniref:hypothetical protein n=1 Tax=Lacinutrix sp. Hel_I_90 TaxID=1249999 RepID=UPI0005C8A18B|nr:hypothetical protein [Lacinutrix sp. Hel_I_90]